ESFISRCRTDAMGTTTVGSFLLSEVTLTDDVNQNNIWIRDNRVYRFASPPIWLKRRSGSTGLEETAYSGLHILNNFIHGDQLDRTLVASLSNGTVAAEDTSHIWIEDATSLNVVGNHL